jgi:hypothetical protein
MAKFEESPAQIGVNIRNRSAHPPGGRVVFNRAAQDQARRRRFSRTGDAANGPGTDEDSRSDM